MNPRLLIALSALVLAAGVALIFVPAGVITLGLAGVLYALHVPGSEA